ncbi:MAG: hypothetical protein M3552_04985, partial [Planctomycetota bacterium]|nr:hypothetical protein [Planctomycetota bacterium]
MQSYPCSSEVIGLWAVRSLHPMEHCAWTTTAAPITPLATDSPIMICLIVMVSSPSRVMDGGQYVMP